MMAVTWVWTQAVTSAAVAPPPVHPSVGRVIQVALRAVRLETVGLPRIAPSLVLAWRHCLKVIGPNAFTVSAAALAYVVPLKPSRRFTNEKMVSKQRDAWRWVEASIAIAGEAAYPQSAAVRTTGIDLRPEALFGALRTFCILIRHREPILSGVMERDVPASPLPSILRDLAAHP